MRGKSPRQANKSSRTRLMKLEPRILFDAAAAAEATQDMADSGAQWSELQESTLPSVASQSTTSATPTLTGTASASGTLAVTVDGTTYTEDDGQLSREGESWSLQIPQSEALENGVYDVTATLTDALGQTSEARGELLIDSTTSVSIGNDDYITNDSTLIFTGQAEAGDSVAVSLNGILLDTVTADAQGNWSLDYSATALTDGSYTLEVEATDALGNTDTASWAVTVAASLSDEQVDSYNSLLADAKTSAIEQIQTYLSSATDAELFKLFAGDLDEADAAWTQHLAELRDAIADGSFFAGLQIQLLDSGELGQSVAAYSADGLYGEPTIFVNAGWLSLLGSDSLATVLIEEYGHHLDHLLNGDHDSAGDEGQHFAIQVTGSSSNLGSDDDHGTLELNGENLAVEHASFIFTNAYAVNTATTPATREQNSLDFIYTSTVASVSISNSDSTSSSFSGNDVLAVALNINGTTYYGWISRPVKVGGDVVGFYFWTDANFTTLAQAQADGNKDGDDNASDNSGFILVVNQAYFDNLGWTNQTNSIKNVGSSSDRVDTALNALLANNPPVAVADTASATEAGGLNNVTPGSDATGNVLTNDTDPNTGDTKTVTLVGTSTAGTAVATGSTSTSGGTAVAGRYGTLTIGADGSYKYVVNNSNTTVEALLPGNTLSETFTYAMADSKGETATTTLTITINGANDTPVAANDYNSAKESIAASDNYTASDTSGSTATGSVLTNDTDKDQNGETKSIAGVDASATGNTLPVATIAANSTATLTITVTSGTITNVSGNYKGDAVYQYNSATGTYQDTGLRVASVSGSTITLKSASGSTATSLTISNGEALKFYQTKQGNNDLITPLVEVASGTTSVTGTASSKVSVSNISQTIAVGMTVTGTGVPAGTTVTAYDAVNKIVTLNTAVTLSNTSLSFSSSAGTPLTGQYGTLVLNSNGSYTYTPTANNANLLAGQTVTETFTYSMRDASGATSTATLYITVTGSGSNDPNAVADTATATEAGGVTNGTAGSNPSGNLVANDTTPTGSKSITLARATSSSSNTTVTTGGVSITGQYGSLTIASDGSYSYTLNNGNASVQALHSNSDTLTDTFLYTLSNGTSTDTATLTITIQGANDAPVASNDTATATEAGGVLNAITGYNPTGNVLSNDSDVDDLASALRVSAVRTGATEGSGTAGTVSSGTYTLVGTYGTLTMGTNGVWSYVLNETALANINAGDTRYDYFNYTVTDSSGSGLSYTAVLTITINPATDTVSVNNVFVSESSSYAVFTVTGTAGTSVTLALSDSTGIPTSDTKATLGTDLGSSLEYWDGTSWKTYTGAVVIPSGNALNVRVAITNDSLYEGNETFTLIATANGISVVGLGTINDDGEGDTSLTAVNDSLTVDEDSTANLGNVSANDSSTSGGSLSYALATGVSHGTLVFNNNGSYSYTPTANYNGTDSLTYTVTDALSGDTATRTVAITVTPVNDAPDAVNDSFTVAEDSGATVLNLLANDSFAPDTGETLTVTAVTQPAVGGSVTLAGGVVSFTPTAHWNGTTSFTYTLSDGNGGTDTATVSVTVTPVNDAPDAVNDSFTVAEDSGATVLNLLANDSFAPDTGETLTVTAVTQPAVGGSVTLVGGVVSFTPTANWNGTTSFTYTLSDGNGGTDTATVSVTVTPVNDAPDAVNDSFTVAEDSGATVLNLLANDSFAPDTGETLTVTAVTQPAVGGSVTLVGGVVSFT
ncbi:beta strand repeat-containing protein, partial [Azotobacter beijerinckii]|uniref:beta strand repeat-containing protein n=1 Tax=Azotobacter beijerinckii TaxID=170623 RepID=UPI002953FA15